MPTQAEINFIRMWTECENDGVVHRTEAIQWFEGSGAEFSPAVFLRNCTPSGTEMTCPFKLLSRGRDLIATARHVGLTNLVADDAPNVEESASEKAAICPECMGRRRVDSIRTKGDRTIVELVEGEPARKPVDLPGWDYTCPTCDGDGEVPARAESEPFFTHVLHQIRSPEIDGHASETSNVNLEVPPHPLRETQSMPLREFIEFYGDAVVGSTVEIKAPHWGSPISAKVTGLSGDHGIFTDSEGIHYITNEAWTFEVVEAGDEKRQAHDQMESASERDRRKYAEHLQGASILSSLRPTRS